MIAVRQQIKWQCKDKVQKIDPLIFWIDDFQKKSSVKAQMGNTAFVSKEEKIKQQIIIFT